MVLKLGINGFGRIGRLGEYIGPADDGGHVPHATQFFPCPFLTASLVLAVMRAALERDDVEVCAFNDPFIDPE